MITEEQAIEILNIYADSKLTFNFPKYDERIIYMRIRDFSEMSTDFIYEEYPGHVIEEYTFIELIKQAYNLTDK